MRIGQGNDRATAYWAVDDVDIGRAGGVSLNVQRLGSGSPRLHLDIETDDVGAEVARVVDLGARVVEQREGYTILTDPGGLVFCVVPVQKPDLFGPHATTWD